jgi:hypothetical protein
MSTQAKPEEYSLNRELTRKRALLEMLDDDDLGALLADFDYDWSTGNCNAKSQLYEYFSSEGWVDQQGRLNRIGRLVYGRIALHFDFFDQPENRIVGNYEIIKGLRSGKNSAIFLANHRSLGFQVVLKFIRPGASDDIENSLKKITSGGHGSTIVMPTDILHVPHYDVLGRPVQITCLVFPYISGQPLNEFLREEGNHLNSHVVISFIIEPALSNLNQAA